MSPTQYYYKSSYLALRLDIMCIYNYYIANNQRYINLSSNPLLYYKRKCGKCYQCKESKSKEMIYRGYYHAMQTFINSGYTLFDTLTYDENHVPHINEVLGINENDNFYCFRNSDITNFFKLLRIRLRRKYKENNTLSFVYTGEYGTNENCTHRPHYHLILYYTGIVKPIDLSLLISECWKYGRTDGVKYKGYDYFINKRVFTNQNSYNLNQTKYILKYIEKDSKYEKTIYLRTNSLCKKLLSNELTYNDKLDAKKIRNAIRQQSRTSINFGLYATNFIDDDELIRNNNLVSFDDTKQVKCFLPLPTYIKRKLYQSVMHYTLNGELLTKWIWNERGRKYYIKLQYNILNIIKRNIHTSVLNTKSDYIKEHIKDISIDKLAKYSYIRRNRFSRNQNIDFNEIINNLFNENEQIINLGTPKLKDMYKCHYIIINGEYKQFHKLKTLNIKDYDYMLNILDNENYELNKKRHENYLKNKELENRAKFLGIK